MTIEKWGPSVPDTTTTAQGRDTDSWAPMLPAVADLAEKICGTEFVPTSLRNSVPKTAAAILFGRELGLPPMTALGSVHVIQGRAGMYAETMRAMIQASGHEIRVTEMTETRCVIKGRRRGDDEWVTASYSMAEAVKAGDAAKNPNYKSRPADMLLARASGRLAKMHFADVIKGLGVAEELSTLGGDVVEVAQVAAPAPGEVESGPVASVGRRRPSEPVENRATAAPAPRQRMTRPAPKTATAPPPAPPAAAETAPATEVVDAEVIDEHTGEVTVDEQRRKVTTYVIMQWDRLKVAQREERLYLTGEVVGRAVASTNDLTAQELSALADELGKARDIRALQAQIDQRKIDEETSHG
mgnify:CR=1 FL=1|jgi:hypothetical protein